MLESDPSPRKQASTEVKRRGFDLRMQALLLPGNDELTSTSCCLLSVGADSSGQRRLSCHRELSDLCPGESPTHYKHVEVSLSALDCLRYTCTSVAFCSWLVQRV